MNPCPKTPNQTKIKKNVQEGEFKDSVEALEKYAGRAYPLDTTKLQALFKDLTTTKNDEPKVLNKIKTSGLIKIEAAAVPSKWEKIS